MPDKISTLRSAPFANSIIMIKLLHLFKRSYDLQISPDGRYIASVNATQINLFDGETYEQIAQWKEMPNSWVRFSHDNRQLAAASVDGKLALYDLQKNPPSKNGVIRKTPRSKITDFRSCPEPPTCSN